MFDQFLTNVEQIEQNDQSYWMGPTKKNMPDHYDFTDKVFKKKKGLDDLPDKIFVPRRSVLTELLEISHIKTIYHIFVAILIVFSLNTLLYDIIEKGRLGLDFGLIIWAFGGFPKVMATWCCMKLSLICIVYPVYNHWSTNRAAGPVRWPDYLWLSCYIVFQICFLVMPLQYLYENHLPPASAVVVVTEQLRMIMKSHSFIRENIPRTLAVKAPGTKCEDVEDMEDRPCKDFSKFLYFLFAPTLIYRHSYPRTPKVRWNYVVSNFMQVLACILYTYYIFERFCVPSFQHFSKEHVSLKRILLSAFGCMLPGALVLFIGFFAVLHSWLNAFAEMLRFADRLFYKDWWNSTTFSSYYRTWNVVVHDWLYTYVYKDFYRIFHSRPIAMGLVFLISAIFHEYVFVVSFGFFYPVLFVFFGGAGFGFVFVTDKAVSRSWNVFMWVCLFLGTGCLMCLYSMEWYARINCPNNVDGIWDYVIPRSWTCNLSLLPEEIESMMLLRNSQR